MTATSVTEKILPGIIGLVIGIYFLMNAEKILYRMINSQERFFKGVAEPDRGMDKNRILFGKIFTYVFGLIAAGVSLLMLYDGIFN